MTVDDSILICAASVVDRARELLDDGWVQGRWFTSVEGVKVKFCIHGALDMALDELAANSTMSRAYRSAVEDFAVFFICDEVFGGKTKENHVAMGWNDAPGRKQVEVSEMMGRVGKRLWNISLDLDEKFEFSKWADVDYQGNDRAQQFLYQTLN